MIHALIQNQSYHFHSLINLGVSLVLFMILIGTIDIGKITINCIFLFLRFLLLGYGGQEIHPCKLYELIANSELTVTNTSLNTKPEAFPSTN